MDGSKVRHSRWAIIARRAWPFLALSSALLATFSGVAPGVSEAWAWETPNGSPTPVNTGSPAFPDPAATGIGAFPQWNSQIYSTDVSQVNMNIPSAAWTTGTSSASLCCDALPSLPPNVPVFGTWAPSVNMLGSEYVMWFSGVQSSGGGALMYVATSSSPQGPFTVQDGYRVGISAYGDLDPYMWQDLNGNWWLFWSQQYGAASSVNYIYSAQLTSNGLSFAGPANNLLSFPQVDNVMGPYFSKGTNAQIENPTFVTDPRGTYPYDLTISYGTWNQQESYQTTVVACDSPSGACGLSSTEMKLFPGQVTGSNPTFQNAGGATFSVGSAQYNEYFMPFAAGPLGSNPTPRTPYFDGTNSQVMRAGDYITAGSSDKGINYCNCLPDGWRLVMQTDGNLVLYDIYDTAHWASHTSGDANSYAIMQGDGNFVVYDNGVAKWATGTGGRTGQGAYLQFQNSDNNLVVYLPSGQALWASGT